MRSALVSVYMRSDGVYVAPSDRTTDGSWIGSGEVEVVTPNDPCAIGVAILRSLDRSRLDVAHPRQDEWTDQRRRSLDPIVKAAGLPSWRAFIREADVVTVVGDGNSVGVEPMRRDGARVEVFYPVPDGNVVLTDPSPDDLGRAVVDSIKTQP